MTNVAAEKKELERNETKLVLSQMGGMECVITGIMDEFRTIFNRWKYSRETFTLGATLFSFCIAITNVTKVSNPKQSPIRN